jgi:hypothetical protein
MLGVLRRTNDGGLTALPQGNFAPLHAAVRQGTIANENAKQKCQAKTR